ncbi:MAG: hypothetical protein M1450_01490 [Patescibacteria group bacterium]|nr:hypothetical protein [Patescibacteria group bacterium]
MNITFKKFFSDNLIFWGFLVTIFFIFLSIIFILFTYNLTPSVIPIFNQMPWGKERLGTRIEFFYPSLLVFSIFISNLFFSKKIYFKMPLISRMLCVTSLLLSLFVFLFTTRTLLLVL